MGVEHERKFLVSGDPPHGGVVETLRQAYVAVDGDRTVRVRQAGDRFTLTVKTGRGLSRTEVEVAIDAPTFDELWAVGHDRSVGKRRTRIPLGDGSVAELDDFDGRHAGLRLVEVEFDSPDAAARFVPPSWFGTEVTTEPWAANAWLAANPWPPADGAGPVLRS